MRRYVTEGLSIVILLLKFRPYDQTQEKKKKRERENDAAYILKTLCSLFKELSSCEEFTACIGSRLSSLHIVLGFNCYRLIVKHWS